MTKERLPIEAEIAQEMPQRLFSLKAIVRCVQASLADSADGDAQNAAQALLAVVRELEELAMRADSYLIMEQDLDICAWPEPEEAQS